MKITEELLSMHVSEFLDLRLANVLEAAGIHTMLDLLRCCSRKVKCLRCPDKKGCERIHLMSVKNFGKSSIDQVLRVVRSKIEPCTESRETEDAGN